MCHLVEKTWICDLSSSRSHCHLSLGMRSAVLGNRPDWPVAVVPATAVVPFVVTALAAAAEEVWQALEGCGPQTSHTEACGSHAGLEGG